MTLKNEAMRKTIMSSKEWNHEGTYHVYLLRNKKTREEEMACTIIAKIQRKI